MTIGTNEHCSVVVHLAQISPAPLEVERLTAIADPDRRQDQAAVGGRLECGRAPRLPTGGGGGLVRPPGL